MSMLPIDLGPVTERRSAEVYRALSPGGADE
ncbi:hypothetical protein GGQ61_000170 [Phenylobacterium haematophilum]|uniref:Uncharacterized protein n=1 Tax=Phenylobacterium haematophilum TaxID=98513 RepID=A0A839ZVQ2_9CAUL|nr:hypothetical protein [Phenylobacterium haematophilum]